MGCFHHRRPTRGGFTLIEMLLVIAVVLLLMAIGFPMLRGPLERSELRGAAREIRAALIETRLNAIESGAVYRFRFQPGRRRFEIGPKTAHDVCDPALGGVGSLFGGDELSGGVTSSLGSDLADGLGGGLNGGVPLLGAGAMEMADVAVSRELTDGIAFAATVVTSGTAADGQSGLGALGAATPSLTSLSMEETSGEPGFGDDDSVTVFGAAGASDEGTWAAPILFYPNGRTSNARIRLVTERGLYLDVSLRGVTGSVTMSVPMRDQTTADRLGHEETPLDPLEGDLTDSDPPNGDPLDIEADLLNGGPFGTETLRIDDASFGEPSFDPTSLRGGTVKSGLNENTRLNHGLDDSFDETSIDGKE